MSGSDECTLVDGERSTTYATLTVRVGPRSAGSARVRIAGELDVDCAGDLLRELRALLDADGCHVQVDLSDLRFCDSSGLGVFLAVRELTLAGGGSIHLVGLHGQPQRLLRTTGAEPFLTGVAVQPGAGRPAGQHQQAG